MDTEVHKGYPENHCTTWQYLYNHTIFKDGQVQWSADESLKTLHKQWLQVADSDDNEVNKVEDTEDK